MKWLIRKILNRNYCYHWFDMDYGYECSSGWPNKGYCKYYEKSKIETNCKHTGELGACRNIKANENATMN